MTDVLVAFASRHGGTDELAHMIGDVVESGGLTVHVRRMEDVDELSSYSAYVLGSAIYMGSWLPAARAFVEEHHELIGERPTWLFSSGPVGEPPHDGRHAFDAGGLLAATHARDHHLFGGKLDRRALGIRERLITRLVRVPEGDFRDLEIAVAWGTAISRALAAGVPAGSHSS
jgi:menaquinone-dependent protoporphyrinogen oxidase